jgi:very-short-patch-repair endonuclease
MGKTYRYSKNLKPFARKLRNESTLGEVILWNKVLRARKMCGYQFNRQFPLENYIVDFICRTLKIIIEVDGYSHNFKHEQDEIRDKKLSELGFKVLRFSEQQVRHDIDSVAEVIQQWVEKLESDKSPLPPF